MKITLTRGLPISTICSATLLASFAFTAQAAGTVPADPDTFLTFLEKHAPEDAVSASAYYAAVDPDNKKTTYADWLKETGFISNTLDYQSTGDFAYNADSIVVHQNVADLGFIRRVSTRCEPGCDDPNPNIYSVIENYPSFDDAAARTNRLASVTMEWVSAADGSNPSDKFVVFYAYTGADSRNQTNSAGDIIPFQPNLDGRGEKAIPGLCNTCHGGAPRKLKKDGSYAEHGNTGALFLPMDLDNFVFDPEVTRSDLTRIKQEAEYKKTNQIVLITHRGTEDDDEVAGISRLPAGHELIEGWYGGAGMPDNTFHGEFVPPGWLPPAAPLGADELYLHAVAPACRSCHVQQERALDFATYAGFMVFEDAHKELVLSIECGLNDDTKDRNKADDQAVMPLALVTYNKFWETNEVNVFKDHLGVVNCDDL